MSITSITIENFKGIGSPVTIPIRPITLLFGPNSAGKSTVIQALHYMRELLENKNANPDKVATGGKAIDLGGFESLIHKHDLSRTVKVRVDFTASEEELESYSEQNELDKNETTSESGGQLNPARVIKDISTAWVEVAICMSGAIPIISEYQVGLNGVVLGRISDVIGRPHIDFINTKHPLIFDNNTEFAGGIREDIYYLLGPITNFEHDEKNETTVITPIPLFSEKSVVPEFGLPFKVDEDEISEAREAQKRAKRFEDFADGGMGLLDKIVALDFLSRLFIRPGEVLLKKLRDSRYIGPIREIPPRNYLPPKTVYESRWADGMGAWDTLGHAAESANENEVMVLKKTNEYLEYLKIPYKITVEEKYLVPVKSKEEILAFISERHDSLPKETRITLHDENNGINVAPCDIGVGISQIIPVVVGAADQTFKVLSIEQPELHVHPAVVCDLGDIFIKEFVGTERIALLETHSEHLVLRILRRIRETTESTQKDGAAIRPGDVAVIVVHKVDGAVNMEEIPIREDGDFRKKWPEGFFTEREQELF